MILLNDFDIILIVFGVVTYHMLSHELSIIFYSF